MLGKEMLGKEMLDQERDEPKRCSLEPLRLRIPPAFLGSHPKLDCFGGITPLQRLEELRLTLLQRFEELGFTVLQQITPLQRLEELGITPAFVGSHPILDCFGGITPLQRLEELGITPAFLGSHPKLDCIGGLHYAYKENIEEVFPWMLDRGWVDSFSIQIPESIQELKKALSVLPQLSSHPKPGCLGGLFSSFDKFLQRIIPGYQQTKKVKEWSWRLAPLNILPEVRFQDHFKTCVFFAVIGAVEGRYRLHMIRNDPGHVTVPQLSVQDAIDGIKQVPIDPATCFKWVIKQGVVPESDCPYIGVPQGGHALKEGRLSVVNGYRIINPGEEHAERIVAEIMEGGPIVGIVSYQSEYLHAVMLIGGVYKDDRVDEYVIQNSWGTGWEEDGRGLVPISYLVGAYVPVLG